mmetsp:Transcript_33881/g.44689  ORF Transcript_33881/g.44689 Transcript_33881/m.44689 type:complete len:584 (+) Transcript_33881:99-1850(+)
MYSSVKIVVEEIPGSSQHATSEKDTCRRNIIHAIPILVLFFVGSLILFVASPEKSQDQIIINTKSDFLSKPGEGEILRQEKQSSFLPNIILYLIDDQGFADMGYNGQDFANLTPNLDAFAADGIKMSRYYTEYVCTPSRASLMTGKIPMVIGMQDLVPDFSEPWGVPLEYKFMPEYMKKLGYSTHLVGKWHLGFSEAGYTPTHRGFDSFFGFLFGKNDYYNHTACSSRAGCWNDFHFNGKTYPEALGIYSTELYNSRVKSLLAEHDKDTPLFLFYSQQLMHSPTEEPPLHYFSDHDLDLVDELLEGDRQIKGKMSLVMDQSFKSMIDELKANGLYDNSYIIVASDNGGCSSDGGYNNPLRGEKNTVFEGGIRANAFIHSPLLPDFKRGTSYDGLFHVSDWLNTILVGMIGSSQTDVNAEFALDDVFEQAASHNLWEHILSPNSELANARPRESIIHNIETKVDGPFIRGAVRHGNFKLIYGERNADWYVPGTSPEHDFCERLWVEVSKETRIFDIDLDPYEKENLLHTIDDLILSDLWDLYDLAYRSQGESAYQETDWGCYEIFAEHNRFLVPWIENEESVGK